MSCPNDARAVPGGRALRFGLFVLLVLALLSLPFVLFGESYALPLIRSQESRTGMLAVVAVGLLLADSVAPVPSILVIMVLAAKTSWWVGALGGTVGLTGQVLCASWFGRAAVGRVAPRFFPEPELVRLRAALERSLALTLGCLRSVPVLAETSVVVAASLGVPARRIFWATLGPNAAISLIYSLAIDDSVAMACVAFAATAVASYALWRAWAGR